MKMKMKIKYKIKITKMFYYIIDKDQKLYQILFRSKKNILFI